MDNGQKVSEKPNGKKSYQLDDLLRMTGGFGLYQATLSAFLCLVSIPAGAQMFIQMFYGVSPPFYCVEIPVNKISKQEQCHPNCNKYEFRGPFTSVASEVIVAQCLRLWRHILDHFSVKLWNDFLSIPTRCFLNSQ